MRTLTQYEVARTLLRQLAQISVTADGTFSMYVPGDGVQAVVKRIIICNHSTEGAAAFDLYHDDDGETFNTATLLYLDETVTLGQTRVLDDELYVDSNGGIGFYVDQPLALTITLYGEETQVRAR